MWRDNPEAVGGLKTAANLEALGVKAKHKSHSVKVKHKFRGTWNQRVEDDLEAVNDPEALDDPEAVGGLKAAADLEALGVKAKHKFRGCKEPKQDQVGLGTKRVEDDLEAVNDPEALDDPEAVGGLKAAADLEALGVKAKHKFRGCKEPKQDQVGLGTKRWRTTSRPWTWPEAVGDLKAAANLEALGVKAKHKSFEQHSAMEGSCLGHSRLQGKKSETTQIKEWKKYDRIVLVRDKDDLGFRIHLLVEFYYDNNSG
nr:unnamed protein product [Ipomoea batatas]